MCYDSKAEMHALIFKASGLCFEFVFLVFLLNSPQFIKRKKEQLGNAYKRK